MASPIKVIKADHIVLNVQDVEASLHFYTGLLGMETTRLEEYRTGNAPFPSVRMGEQLIDLFPPGIHEVSEFTDFERQRVNHFCVRISPETALADIETYLQQQGVVVQSRSARNFGAYGYGPSLYILDPDGNTVELKQYFEQT